MVIFTDLIYILLLSNYASNLLGLSMEKCLDIKSTIIHNINNQ